MEHKNNTGSCNTTASDANLLSLVNDVMPDFKKFIKGNFKSIIVAEIEEMKKIYKSRFTAIAHTYPTNGKDFKYDYLFHAISIERPTIDESYKLMQNFATYSVEDKYLIDLSLKDIALVFGKAAVVCPPRASFIDPLRQNMIDPLRQNKNDP